MKAFNSPKMSVIGARPRGARLILVAFLYGIAAPAAFGQNADGDVINLTAGIGVTRDSNVLRISEQGSTLPYGSDSRGDTFLRGNLGISFDRLISQQRIQASAEVEGYKYNEYDDFDNVGYNAGLNYDWVIGRPFFGRIGGRVYRFQPTIQDRLLAQPTAPRNDIERQTFVVNGGIRLTPSWSAIAGWDIDRRRNSSFVYEDTDTDINTFELGGRYAPGTGTEIDLVYRRSKGDYKSAQLYGTDGTPLLITGRNNDYNQDAIVARVQYKPSEDSALAGRIGLTRRNYDVDPSRDFSGVTTGFDVTWAQSGAIQMKVSVSRDIQPDDNALVSTYADSRTIAIAPVIRATGKIQLSPFYQYAEYRYKGEGGGSQRKDRLNSFGLGVDYEIRRNLNALLDLRREDRSSSIDFLDYTANVVSLGIRARF